MGVMLLRSLAFRFHCWKREVMLDGATDVVMMRDHQNDLVNEYSQTSHNANNTVSLENPYKNVWCLLTKVIYFQAIFLEL